MLAYRIVLAQAGIAAAVALGFLIGSGWAAALAALAGGAINVLANLFLVRYLFAPRAPSPHRWVRAFYAAEAAKLLLTAALLVFALAVLKLAFVPLFAGFAATLAAFWLALLPRFSAPTGSHP